MKIRFDYEIAARKTDDIDPREFVGCESLEELKEELLDRAPNVEWSVYVNEGDADLLWAEVQKLRA